MEKSRKKKLKKGMKRTLAFLLSMVMCMSLLMVGKKPVVAEASGARLSVSKYIIADDPDNGYIWVQYHDSDTCEYMIRIFGVKDGIEESVMSYNDGGRDVEGPFGFHGYTDMSMHKVYISDYYIGHQYDDDYEFKLEKGMHVYDDESKTTYVTLGIAAKSIMDYDGQFVIRLYKKGSNNVINETVYNFPKSYYGGYIKDFEVCTNGDVNITWSAPKSLRNKSTQIHFDFMSPYQKWQAGYPNEFTSSWDVSYGDSRLSDPTFSGYSNTFSTRIQSSGIAGYHYFGSDYDFRPGSDAFFAVQMGIKSFDAKRGLLCVDRFKNPKLRTAKFSAVPGEKYSISGLRVESITETDNHGADLDNSPTNETEIIWSCEENGFNIFNSNYKALRSYVNTIEGTFLKKEGNRVFFKATTYFNPKNTYKLNFKVLPMYDDLGYEYATGIINENDTSWRGISMLTLTVPYGKECEEGEHEYEWDEQQHEDGCHYICEKCGKEQVIDHEYDSGDLYQTNSYDRTHYRVCVKCNYIDEHTAESDGHTVFVNPKQFLYCQLPACKICNQGIEPDVINDGIAKEYHHEWEFINNGGNTHTTKCKKCNYVLSENQECFSSEDLLLSESDFLDVEDMEKISSSFAQAREGEHGEIASDVTLTCVCGNTTVIPISEFCYDYDMAEDTEEVSLPDDAQDAEESGRYDSLNDEDSQDKKLDVGSADEIIADKLIDLNNDLKDDGGNLDNEKLKTKTGDNDIPDDAKVKVNKKTSIEIDKDSESFYKDDESYKRKVRYKIKASSVLTVTSASDASYKKTFEEELEITGKTTITVMLPDDFGKDGDIIKITDVKNGGTTYGTVKMSENGALLLSFYSEHGLSTFEFEYSANQDEISAERRISGTYKGGTITFDKNADDAVGTMATQTVEAAAAVTENIGDLTYTSGISCSILDKNEFTRNGYSFDGWNTMADGTGLQYADESEIKISGNTTLYAQWKKLATITYVKNNEAATGEMDPQTVVSGKSCIVKQSGFTLDRNIVSSWNTASDGTGVPYTPYTSATFTDDTTLYAQWTDNTVNVTFDKNTNDSAGTMDAQVVEKNKSTALNENTFAREGYAFAGWNTKADGTGTNIADGANVTLKENTTLYAQWAQDFVTVTYYPNGATGDEIVQKVVRGQKINLKTGLYDAPVGKLFGGWNTTAADSGDYYADGAEVIVTSNLNLHARWKDPAVIKFCKYSQNEANPITQTIPQGTPTALLPNTYEEDGYVFVKWDAWYLDNTTSYEDEAVITCNTGELPLIAHFEQDPDSCKIRFVANGASGGSMQVYQYIRKGVPTALVKCGYNGGTTKDFAGWNTEQDGSGTMYTDEEVVTLAEDTPSEFTLYGQWRGKEAVVTFDANGGEGYMESQSFYYGDDDKPLTPNAFTREGYTFKNWNTMPDGSGSKRYNDSTYNWYSFNTNPTLYAQWEPLVQVNFDKNAPDAEGEMEPQYVKKGVDVPAKKNMFSREGYEFRGWNKDGTLTYASITDGGDIHFYSWDPDTITYYAIWRVNTKANVKNLITLPEQTYTYDGEPHESVEAAISFENQSTYTIGTGGGFTYTYQDTKGNDLDGAPTEPGYYTVTATYEDSKNKGSKTAYLTIRKASVTLTPEASSITLNGEDGVIRITADKDLSDEEKATAYIYNQVDESVVTLGDFSWEGNTCTIPVNYVGKGYTYVTFAIKATERFYGSSTSVIITSRDGYDIKLGSANGGYTRADKAAAKPGETVTIICSPKKGYSFDVSMLSVTNRDTKEAVTLTDEGNGCFTFTMPKAAVDVSSSYSQINYTISYLDEEGVAYEDGAPISARYGDTVTVSAATSLDGKDISGFRYYYDTDSGEAYLPVSLGADKKATFKMPSYDIRIKAVTGDAHDITVADGIVGGSISTSSACAAKNAVITVTPTANDGYTLEKITCTYTGGTTDVSVKVSMDDEGAKIYTFVMPDNAVTVNASFVSDSDINTKVGAVTVTGNAEQGANEASVDVSVDAATRHELENSLNAVDIDLGTTGNKDVSEAQKTEAVAALSQAGKVDVNNTNNDNVRVVEKTYMDIAVRDYEDSGNEKSMTLSITPMKQTVATIENAGIELTSENSVPISAPERLTANEIPKTTNVRVGITDAIAEAAGGAGGMVYVRHNHNGRIYEYHGLVGGSAGSYTAEFTNPHGYSDFTISVQSNTVASYTKNAVTYYYPSLEDAVNDAIKAEVYDIKMYSMPTGNDTATISAPVTLHFTVADGKEAFVNLDALYNTWIVPTYGMERASTAEQLAANTFVYQQTVYGIKKTVTIETNPVAGEITEGQTLAMSNLNGGLAKYGDENVSGTFTWLEPSVKPLLADSETTEYDVLFTPDNYSDYESAITKITLVVNENNTIAKASSKEETPELIFAADGSDSGLLSGLTVGGQYMLTGAVVTTFTATYTTYLLEGVSPGELYIVKKGNGINTLDSNAQTINITKAGTPSTVTASACTTASQNNGKLSGITDAMEYKKSDSNTWAKSTGDVTGLVPGTYYVRIKASGTVLASDNQELVITAYTAPAQVVAPVFGRAARTYTEGCDVSISTTTGGATIYYTTDGSAPNTGSNVYNSAIHVTSTTTIKAIAVRAGMVDSVVTSATYTIVPRTYNITVINGTTNVSKEAAGRVVTITANAPASGMEFDKWITGDNIAFSDAGQATTTFIMPAGNVSVTATYKEIYVEPTPVDPTPVDPTPVDPTPVDPTPIATGTLTGQGIYCAQDNPSIIAAFLTEKSNAADTVEYKWVACNENDPSVWFVVSDWTRDNYYLSWTPSKTGNYIIVAYARLVGNEDNTQVQDSFGVNFKKQGTGIKEICQMPYQGEGGGYLIGFESYDNPNQEYQYEMFVMDLSLLAAGSPTPWVHATGKIRLAAGATPEEGRTMWTIWQPQYGYYLTLFRLYDKDGEMIDEVPYGFANAY